MSHGVATIQPISLYDSFGIAMEVQNGVAIPSGTSGILIHGTDGTNARRVLVDTAGRLNVVGAAAHGAAVAGNPVFIAGADASGNVQRVEFRSIPPVGSVAGEVTREVVSQTGTTTSVASSTSNVTLLSANTSRLGAVITNDGNKTLFVKCGTTASTSSYTYILLANERIVIDFGYTGILDGIWDSANGNARITEFT